MGSGSAENLEASDPRGSRSTCSEIWDLIEAGLNEGAAGFARRGLSGDCIFARWRMPSLGVAVIHACAHSAAAQCRAETRRSRLPPANTTISPTVSHSRSRFVISVRHATIFSLRLCAQMAASCHTPMPSSKVIKNCCSIIANVKWNGCTMGKRKKISKRLNDVAATLTQISARLAALESRKRRSRRKPPVEGSSRQHIADSPPDPTPTFSTVFADEETVNLRRFLSNPGAAGCVEVARGGRFFR